MMKMKRFPVVKIVISTTLMLLALLEPVYAKTPRSLEHNVIAMGGRVETPRKTGTQEMKTGPKQMIHIGESQFDPLHQMPSPNASLKTIQRYGPGRKGYYIVQFDGPIQSGWKESLKRSGAEIFDYLPDFSFIVQIPSENRTLVERLPHVRWVGIYQPSYRISRGAIAKLYSQGAGGVPAKTVLRVDLFPGVDLSSVAADINALGGVIQEQSRTALKTTLKVDIPVDRIADLPSIEGVKWIEPMPRWKLFNDVSTDIMRVRSPRNARGLYGRGQVVGIADSGLDQGATTPDSLHDDFEDGKGASRVLQIIDRVPESESGVEQGDLSGHGTHVAGSVLGNGIMSGSDPAADYFPVSSHAGAAPKANLIFQALENNDTGSLDGIPTNLNTLFGQADSAGAHLHTNSWGSIAGSAYTIYSQDVDEYIWSHPDFLILYAAGNEGIDMDSDGVIDAYSLGSPATAKNCLTVGASEGDRPNGAGYDLTWGTIAGPYYPANPVANDHLSNNDRGMAAFSSRGPTLDGRYKPDIVAPGTNILSTRTQAVSSSADIGWGNLNDSYVWMGGTSMATPLAAGAAALMREYLVTKEGFASPSAALIKAALLNSAEDLSPGQYGTGATQEIPDAPIPNNVQGWGRLSLEDGLYPAAPFTIRFYDEASGLNTGGGKDYVVNVTDPGAPLRINLTWTDYPGTPSAQGGLVNDLDLQVTDPSASVFYPDNALQKAATSTISYDTDAYDGWIDYNYAVRFTPTGYPAYLDSATFAYYNDGTTANADIVVYGDNAGLPDTGNQLFRKTLTFVPTGFITIPLNLTIASGNVHIAVERAADGNFGMIIESGGNPTGRSSHRDTLPGSPWETSPYTAIIRANVRYNLDYATTFDRVNNCVGITINSPAAGAYTVRVAGYNIAQGPQPFALVASGNISSTGKLTFSSPAYEIDEDAGTATVTVSRINGADGPASLDFATSDGTAANGTDYTGVSGTFDWADGDSSDKSFTVAIIDNAANEPGKTINLRLTNISGAIAGGTTQATLTIIEDDTTILVGMPPTTGSGGGGGGGCFIASLFQ